MPNSIRLKQGTIVPTTGISAGLLTLTIYLVIGFNFGFFSINGLFALPLLLFYLLLQFSYKDVVFEPYANEFTVVYRIFYFFPLKKKKSFTNYKTYVLKVIRKSYVVGRGQTTGMTIVNGTRREKYYAIVAKKKSNDNVVEICKGPKKILKEIVNNNLLHNMHTTYLGTPRKDMKFKFPGKN